MLPRSFFPGPEKWTSEKEPVNVGGGYRPEELEEADKKASSGLRRRRSVRKAHLISPGRTG
jgi:hypothetical protein